MCVDPQQAAFRVDFDDADAGVFVGEGESPLVLERRAGGLWKQLIAPAIRPSSSSIG